jgi:hypothetical protein
MSDEEFLHLIELVEGLLREHGKADIAAESNFVETPESEEGTARLMEPREHLIALLEAIDIHLMLNDSSVAKRSLALISEACDGEGPPGAIVIMPSRRDISLQENLLHLPDFQHVREELKKLIYRLREIPGGGGFSGMEEL